MGYTLPIRQLEPPEVPGDSDTSNQHEDDFPAPLTKLFNQKCAKKLASLYGAITDAKDVTEVPH
jgi:hypothetical protein